MILGYLKYRHNRRRIETVARNIGKKEQKPASNNIAVGTASPLLDTIKMLVGKR